MCNTRRNRCMDTLKGIACIAVVLIHYNWGGASGAAIKAAGRFAVPFFFFISGYYLVGSDLQIRQEATKRKLHHILRLYGKCFLFYFIFCILWNFTMDPVWDLYGFFGEHFSFPKIVKFLVTNDPFVYPHLWYMQALIYCYVFMLLMKQPRRTSGIWVLSLALLAGFSVLTEFSDVFHIKNVYRIMGTDKYLLISALFIFRALPFFVIGYLMRVSGPSDNRKIPGWILVALMLVGTVSAVLEDHSIKLVLMYLGTYVTVFAMALACIWYPDFHISSLEFVGRELSMYVYIYHIAVGKFVDIIAAKFHLWYVGWYELSRPLIVLGGSLALAYAFFAVKNRKKLKVKY